MSTYVIAGKRYRSQAIEERIARGPLQVGDRVALQMDWTSGPYVQACAPDDTPYGIVVEVGGGGRLVRIITHGVELPEGEA